jgi:hypothetical protein
MSKGSLVLTGIIIVVLAGVRGAVPDSPDHASAASVVSPYVGQLGSSVRGLSLQEVDDLLNGLGHGYARMAELNGYPGPVHVLQLKRELGLTPDQITGVESVFQRMQANETRLGKEIVDRERQISDRFAHRTITTAELHTRVENVAKLYGELRTVHLRAHLAITPLLSAGQIAKYNQLRGYADTQQPQPGLHQGH